MNVLEQAAELIESGWCKANLIDNGKVCSLGAIIATIQGYTSSDIGNLTTKQYWDIENLAYENETNDIPAVKALAAEIKKQHPRFDIQPEDYDMPDYEVIYSYNDEQKSGEPVLEMFKHAAKRLDDNS